MKTIQVPNGTQLAFISDIHAHPEQFFKILDKIQPSEKMWLISGSDLIDKGFGEKAENLIIDKVIELTESGICYSVLANHELKCIKKNRKELNPSTQLKWMRSLPLCLSFEFYNNSRVTMVHAGIRPNMTWESLETDIEVCYIRDLDEDNKMIPLIWKDINGAKTLVPAKEGGKCWHLGYDGRFGFVVSGHASQKDAIPKFYNYSLNIDCAVFETGILSAQIFTTEGKLGELIQVFGTPFHPKLNEQF